VPRERQAQGMKVKRPPERPLDPLPTLKLKLSVVILAAVAVTVVVFWAGVRLGMWASVSGVIAAIIALVVVFFLSRGLTSPLREMVAASEAMARGDFSQRITATSHDEIGTLARSFNQMADELAETDRQRRDLVANVSHELRTPITALQAVLENIVDGVAEPDRETVASSRSGPCSISHCARPACTRATSRCRSRSSPAPSRWKPTTSGCTRSLPTSSPTRCAIRLSTGTCSYARPRSPTARGSR